MKIPIEKTCLSLILTTAFALTLAMAGDVLASPCCRLEAYNSFTYNPASHAFAFDNNTKFLDQNPLDSTSVGGGGYSRLWLGTDTIKRGPGGIYEPWMYAQFYTPDLAYEGAADYALDLHTAVAQNGGGAGPFTIQLRAAGAALVFVNGSPTPSLILDYPTPASHPGPGNLPANQFSNGSFTVDFATQANSFLCIPIEVVYFFDKVNHPNQVASGFDLDLNNNPIIYPHITSAFPDITACLPDTKQVNEPSTMLLVGFGLMGLAGYGRKRFKE